jgi:transcriptional regulator with XRE-family HTH domain
MDLVDDLRAARCRAGLSQRELAARTGIAQPTIARIERRQVEPRVGTVSRLLDACGARLVVEPVAGWGVDRTQMRELLRLTPRQRLDLLREDVAALDQLERLVGR